MTDSNSENRLIQAYERMMDRVKAGFEDFEQAEADALPRIRRSIERAAEKAVDLGELTREEAQTVGRYLRRDLEDAGRFLATTGRDLRDWLRFDLELIEDRLRNLLDVAADKTRVEMLAFEETVERAAHYRTGEITGPGTLQCDRCGKLLHFHATAHIPPCATCHGTDFHREAVGQGD